ncbi:MAG TPA: arylsulfotransferase family protein [Myxococcota bacterium]|nr:arylsulfotransferase family protein [Myxococcota bacterium]
MRPSRLVALVALVALAAPGCRFVRRALGDDDHGNRATRRLRRTSDVEVDEHIVRDAPADNASVDPALAARLAELGYVDGLVEADDGPTAVTQRAPGADSGGWNFYTVGGQTAAFLVDMDGHEVWRWTVAVGDVWPELADEARKASWRRALLLPGGDVIGVWTDYGVARVDRTGAIRWARYAAVHHDLQLTPDGGVIVLEHEPRRVPWIDPDRDVFEDFVVWLGPDGSELRRVSVLEAFKRNPDFRRIWGQRSHDGVDPFHTNSLEVLDDRLVGDGSPLRPGQILLSMRHLDTVAVLDPDAETITWTLQDTFHGQHDPRTVGPFEILVFDNRGLKDTSRLLAYDVRTKQRTWSYEGDPAHPFFTIDCGHAQRLADGHTLVNESAAGRAFEITPEGKTVWEYRSPYRVGGGKVARFYEFRRVSADADMAWLARDR